MLHQYHHHHQQQTKRHKYPSESTHGRGALRGSGPRSPACVQTRFTVAPSPLSISQMALIITGGVSVNEPSLGGHLLSLFQFPRGEYGGGGGGWGQDASIFSCFAVINYGTDKIPACLGPAACASTCIYIFLCTF